MIVIAYFIVTLLVLYINCAVQYTQDTKVDLKGNAFHSILWPISVPYAIYLMSKETN